MKLDAVGVTSSNLHKTADFYKLLGFKFPEFKDGDQHLEAITTEGSARLMIDSVELIKDMIGEEPKLGNTSQFAIQYPTSAEVNQVAKKIQEYGFLVIKEPWDAFWGQRYCVVEDPDGHKVDLYANLSPFAKNLQRELVDESKEISLRRDFAPDEATGRRYLGRKPGGAS